MEKILNDHSSSFAQFRKALTDARGVSYFDFLKTLSPDYRRVRRDIGLGYAMIVLTAVLVALMPSVGVPGLLAAVLGAVSIGYWVAYLQLFIHEGAHFNLAPDREASDRFCDRWISWIIGTTVAEYRIVHFQHHRALGTTDDSEHSYFFPLNLMFFAKTLLGIRVAEVIFDRKSRVAKASRTARPKAPRGAILALVVHGGIVVLSLVAGFWWLALAWLAGIGAVFPFFGALRQFLEHRDEAADSRTDYRATNHGALTRMFEDGPFGETFGGAGFNRHLLHHWEPQVSYTNLPELERFLMETELRPIIEGRKTTYAATFLKLLSI